MPEELRAATKARKMIRKKARQVKDLERGARVSFEERHRMIAENAYYRAKSRKFRGGRPEQDWLEAESEIDQMLIDPREEE